MRERSTGGNRESRVCLFAGIRASWSGTRSLRHTINRHQSSQHETQSKNHREKQGERNMGMTGTRGFESTVGRKNWGRGGGRYSSQA